MDSENFNTLIRCQQAIHFLMREQESLELSADEMETLKLMQVSVTESIELITGEQSVII